MINTKKYWEERLTKSYNLHSVGYLGLGKGYNKFMYKVRKAVFTKVIKKLKIQPDAHILDIGSGTGFYIELWKKLGFKNITGSDLTTVAVENLKNKYTNSQFISFDISDEHIPLKEKEFDVISIMDVLFHIVDDKKYQKAINNISKLIKKNGYLIYSDNFIHNDLQVKSAHHVNRKIDWIYQELNNNNFEIILRKPMFYFMNTPVDTNNTFLKKLWQFQIKYASKNRYYSYILGFLFYPLELIALMFINEGPSTEILICKKK